MTYIKLIFFLILVMMDRCGIVTPLSRRDIISVETEQIEPVNLNGSWRLDNVGISQIKVNRLPDSLSNEMLKIEKEEDLLLSFFPDSTFTEVKNDGQYATGKWKYAVADSSLSMIYADRKEKYKVSFNRGKNGLREVALGSFSGKNLLMAGFGRSMEKFQDDPFYPSNNTWRKKPLQPENDQQIRERLNRYVAHNAYLLNAAYLRRQQIISWEFSKGIIKIYNGGIGLVSKDQIPQIWIDSFYSIEDALKAYEIFDNYLRTTSYKGKATGDWVKDDYLILLSIHEGLKRTA